VRLNQLAKRRTLLGRDTTDQFSGSSQCALFPQVTNANLTEPAFLRLRGFEVEIQLRGITKANKAFDILFERFACRFNLLFR
jgi:hypothetical protein